METEIKLQELANDEIKMLQFKEALDTAREQFIRRTFYDFSYFRATVYGLCTPHRNPISHWEPTEEEVNNAYEAFVGIPVELPGYRIELPVKVLEDES